MTNFNEKLAEFYKEFGEARKMVLSTSENESVSSRMMSVILIDEVFYFQTDKNMKKYAQLIYNPHAALCIDNIQIEGVYREIGRPLENDTFRRTFEKCFKGSYDMYSALDCERVFALFPMLIERWIYIGGKPYTEAFRIKSKEYEITKYLG